jgi:hypothetical protein
MVVVMAVVDANDLKSKGVKAFEEALQGQLEASLFVGGEVKYVVMDQQQYQYLRECELVVALAESKTDLGRGHFVKETVVQHIKRIQQINTTASRLGS